MGKGVLVKSDGRSADTRSATENEVDARSANSHRVDIRSVTSKYHI